jgi:hypothetical protein
MQARASEPTLNNAGTLLQSSIKKGFSRTAFCFHPTGTGRLGGNAVFERWFGHAAPNATLTANNTRKHRESQELRKRAFNGLAGGG